MKEPGQEIGIVEESANTADLHVPAPVRNLMFQPEALEAAEAMGAAQSGWQPTRAARRAARKKVDVAPGSLRAADLPRPPEAVAHSSTENQELPPQQKPLKAAAGSPSTSSPANRAAAKPPTTWPPDTPSRILPLLITPPGETMAAFKARWEKIVAGWGDLQPENAQRQDD